jgi:putative DNA methylase
LNDDRRFIEESFPVKEVSFESAREKSIRHGHLSTLHIWWARRPLASSRTTNYAALIPVPKEIEEWNKQKNFIIELSKWENSLNFNMINKAKEEILRANNGTPPKVLDPFAGGGAIPLEALRLGCEVYANDYNPVAVLIEKCTLEYPQKYGKLIKKNNKNTESLFETEKDLVNPLLEDIKKWGNWILKEVKKEIGIFYPIEEDGALPVGYIWARTIPCQNPSCGATIPLMRQFWLAKKTDRKISLYPYIENKEVKFKIVGTGYDNIPKDFNPENGTISKTIVTCPICGTTIDSSTTKRLFKEGKSSQKMISVILTKKGISGKKYRISNEKDMETFNDVTKYLEVKKRKLLNEWGIEPIPDELMNENDPTTLAGRGYGIKYWSEIFNSRQILSLIIFVEKIRKTYKEILLKYSDEEYSKAIVSYLALGLDRLASYNTANAPWHVTGEKATQIFGRQAIPMVWDYTETNPFSESFSWQAQMDWIYRCIEHFSKINSAPATITQLSATSLTYPDNFFDAIFTDPPYYDNIYYSVLSDFFYVWLKRSLGNVFPELFSTPLTPKKNEIVSNPANHNSKEEAKIFFETMLKKSFQEIYRVLKPNGVVIIVYAHKSTEGWETLVNSLLDSGLVMTGAWPINTEMQTRLIASETAALASSIYIVARKTKRQQAGFYNDVKEELKKHLNHKLDRLWQEGVGGADFFISAIGSSIEIFGKYEKVIDYEGNVVRADRLLEDVRKIATDYAVRQILHNGFAGEISDLTRFYVLFRWNYKNLKVKFDEARKLAQSCSIELSNLWGKPGFIKKETEFIRILGPHERKIEDISNHIELIEVLHKTLLLWEKGKRDEMLKLLKESGYGEGEAFYRVAQAISETLPKDDKEKKLLDGFLSGREHLKEEIKKVQEQRRFF